MSLISIYAPNPQIENRLLELLSVMREEWAEPICATGFSDFSGFLESGRHNPRRILILAQEGTTSVELVATAVEECPSSPVVWLSDLDFALYSYHLEVAYFGLLPVTKEMMHMVLRSCGRKKQYGFVSTQSASQIPAHRTLWKRLADFLKINS